MFKKYLKANRLFVLSLIIATLIYFSGVWLVQKDRLDRKTEVVNLESTISETQYKDVIQEIVYNLNLVETFALTAGINNLSNQAFIEFASNLEPEYLDFQTISIAPDGIIKHYYTSQNWEGLVGHDLLSDSRDEVHDSIAYSIEEHVIIVNGPFGLLNGREGIVFRKPVYVDYAFVGIVSIVVDYEELQDAFMVENMPSVDVGIFDSNNTLIFGDTEYSDDMFKYEKINIEFVDWVIGVNINESFNNSEDMKIATIGALLIFMYIIMIYLWANYYHKIKNYIKHQNKLINYDSLTNLPNRRMFVNETNKLIEKNQNFYLGFGDLDNFKNINDVLGHSVGDEYLLFLSDKLKKLVSNELKIYRWGGDEFMFIFIENNENLVVDSIDEIFDILKEPFDINGSKHQISISIGVVNYPDDSQNLDDLVRRADIVMYDIKAHYKNTYSFFEERYLDKLYEEVEFKRELDTYSVSDFEVYYQPIIDVHTSKIVGFEALSRLFNAEGKPYNTYSIIKSYEKEGTITNLDKHVFRQVCLSLKKISQTFDKEYFITFNISPLSLNNDYIQYMKRTVRGLKIDTSKIIVEIIETLGFRDVESSVQMLSQMKHLGFRIAMDDFGMGYSSLSYIAKLPLDIIKIDKTFIHTYKENDFNFTILNTIQDISESLHLETLVEGIETQTQFDFVQNLGVDYYQGFLHSRPEPFNTILQLIKEDK